MKSKNELLKQLAIERQQRKLSDTHFNNNVKETHQSNKYNNTNNQNSENHSKKHDSPKTLYIPGITSSLTLYEDYTTAIGSYLWDGALVLIDWMSSCNRTLWNNKICLELGSGIGIVGIVAIKLGVKQMMVSDRSEVIPTLQKNIELNEDLLRNTRITITTTTNNNNNNNRRGIYRDQMENSELFKNRDFNNNNNNNNNNGDPISLLQIEEIEWAKTHLNFGLEEKNDQDIVFDIILGADIVYNRESFSNLKKEILAHCRNDRLNNDNNLSYENIPNIKKSSTQVYIAYRERNKEAEDHFFEELKREFSHFSIVSWDRTEWLKRNIPHHNIYSVICLVY